MLFRMTLWTSKYNNSTKVTKKYEVQQKLSTANPYKTKQPNVRGVFYDVVTGDETWVY